MSEMELAPELEGLFRDVRDSRDWHGSHYELRDFLRQAYRLGENAGLEKAAAHVDNYAATYKDPLLESVTRGAANFVRLQMPALKGQG